MRQAQRERAEAESGKQRELEQQLRSTQRVREGSQSRARQLEELLREKQLEVRQLQRDCIKYQERISEMGRDAKALQQGYNELQNKLEQSQMETSKTLEDLKRTDAELDTCKSQLDEAQKQASVAIAERSTMEQNAQHREASMKAEAEQTLDSVRFRLGGELKEMELRLDEVDRSGTMTPGQEGSISGPGSWSGSTVHNGRKAGAQNWTASGLVPAEYWRGWG
ncbi:hypothetical protein CesoFtcFv8_000724 [Champsocephalus esox]|uniref:Uncharacterized protein n=1 Tax=Champsocephalus esox TaxID=159716 RepID=A0AAN8HH13_9TELE|nr:hypothetical protein CesoFtcFv8_000724 [Champsocephalus esox]